jgi:hypothetical protein
MLDFRLRGYVSPEDFSGSDTERIQKAFDTSHELDIGRVVLKGNYVVNETIWIHPMTDLVLENAKLESNGNFPVLANRNLAEKDKHNYSFRDQYITIRGQGCFLGDVVIYNAFHVNVDGVEFAGELYFAFTKEVRLYNSKFTGENGVVLGVGSNNFIMQNLTSECKGSTVITDPTIEKYDYVIGQEPEIHDVILQDSTFNAGESAITLRASADVKIYNMQIDHVSSNGVTLEIGKVGEQVPAECYFNLTGEHFSSKSENSIILNNPVKNCYFPK